MVDDIRLQHFRSYDDESFEFERGVNIIVGPNASGKTNLLEALQMVCIGRSYRAHDVDLVQIGQSWSRLDAHTSVGPRTLKLEQIELNRVQKTFTIAGKDIKRLSHSRAIPIVLFEPNHLLLLTGPRDLRRDFLDDLLEQISADFGLARRQYKRALAQRNALLKQGPNSVSQLFAWNIRLSELGGKIALGRVVLIKKLNSQIDELYHKLANDKAKVKLSYISTCDKRDYGSHLLKKLELSTEQDMQRGFTSYGPHRDDFEISLGGKPTTDIASRGETRTLLLALKLLELEMIEQVRLQKPILLLDDVFSELDGARRRALTKFLSEHQTFITTTDADIVVEYFMDSCNIIPLTKPTT